MYSIKQYPEDFIVNEISEISVKDNGKYVICILRKRNYPTLRAIEHISISLGIPAKSIGFAGNKDRNAVTEQKISIKGISKSKIKNISLKDISLEFLGFSDEPISLGQLEKNKFIITVRSISNSEMKQLNSFSNNLIPNYFGMQRFSSSNPVIGKCLVKGMYKEALKIIQKSNSEYASNKGSDIIGAIRSVPERMLKMYVHSYQSLLWNRTLSRYLKISNENVAIPIVGFGSELDNGIIGNIIKGILSEENLTYRDFIIRQIPYLSSEGSFREAFVEIEGLKISPEKDKAVIEFSLCKGSYATVAIACLFDSLHASLKDFI
ncbi:tRNA pseudouridine(13) synthase TruD [Candidatus Woesearchaeota archaeon]|nr:tRNA pseudouridine(13) synthase TruD [Candidatus Woesearchaeota archaeon]